MTTSQPSLKDVSFDLRKDEILGVAGLMGSKRNRGDLWHSPPGAGPAQFHVVGAPHGHAAAVAVCHDPVVQGVNHGGPGPAVVVGGGAPVVARADG
ncbi:MAG TPA: hypothetical protein VNT01_03630 [Symbiobacteriaceae bacterium]|nr:hypothetical protein [Symbiobacteriaceae bacterium]